MKKINKDIKKNDQDLRALKVKIDRTKEMPEVKDYVDQKKKEQVLKESVKNWKRKIEIAEIAAKEAKRKIRRAQMRNR